MSVLSRRLLAAAAAVAVALVLPRSAGAGDDAPVVPPSTPVAPKPADAGPAVDSQKSAAIQKMVAELRDEVSRIRGLEWKQPVPADVMSRESLKQEMIRQIKEELKPDVYERDVKLARRLGMLAANEDPIELTMTFLESGIAGFYDPKTKRFFVIEGLQGDAQRPTIAHELLHALEDQYFDLRKLSDAIEEDDDRLFAMQCVEEGSAEFLRFAYQKSHPEIAKLYSESQQNDPAAAATTIAAMKVPAFLVVSTLLHYQTGPRFVKRAVGNGSYHDTMERLFKDPPVSEEQVLHPGRYLGKDRDLPRHIAWPENLAAVLGEGWKGYKTSTIGELDFGLFVDRWAGGTGGRLSLATMAAPKCCTSLADKASEGWDGATIQLLERASDVRTGTAQTAIAAIFAWDSPADAREAADAIGESLKARYGAELAKAAWTEADGERRLDYTNSLGRGRLVVRGDVIRWLEGAPFDQFEAAWFRVAAAAVTRDPADTWSKDKEPDPLAGAAWKSRDGSVGWMAPSDSWRLEASDTRPATLRFDDLEVEVSMRASASLQTSAREIVLEAMQRFPGAQPTAIEEITVSGHEAAKIPMDDPGKKPGARSRSLIIVPLGERVLVLVASAPKPSWAARAKDVEAAMEGFVFPD